MTFIAGAFTATWNSRNLGSTEDGFELSYNRIQEEIRTDMFRGLLDAVHQGIDMSIRAVFMEADFEGLRALIWPFDADWDGTQHEATGTSPNLVMANTGLHGGTGQLISALAAPLVLTACAATTAKTSGNPTNGLGIASITFPKTVLSTDAVSLKYASSLRKVPVTLTVLPDSTGAVAPATHPYCNSGMVFFTVT